MDTIIDQDTQKVKLTLDGKAGKIGKHLTSIRVSGRPVNKETNYPNCRNARNLQLFPKNDCPNSY